VVQTRGNAIHNGTMATKHAIVSPFVDCLIQLVPIWISIQLVQITWFVLKTHVTTQGNGLVATICTIPVAAVTAIVEPMIPTAIILLKFCIALLPSLAAVLMELAVRHHVATALSILF